MQCYRYTCNCKILRVLVISCIGSYRVLYRVECSEVRHDAQVITRPSLAEDHEFLTY